jgi:hypothetical protein
MRRFRRDGFVSGTHILSKCIISILTRGAVAPHKTNKLWK